MFSLLSLSSLLQPDTSLSAEWKILLLLVLWWLQQTCSPRSWNTDTSLLSRYMNKRNLFFNQTRLYLDFPAKMLVPSADRDASSFSFGITCCFIDISQTRCVVLFVKIHKQSDRPWHLFYTSDGLSEVSYCYLYIWMVNMCFRLHKAEGELLNNFCGQILYCWTFVRISK